MHYQLFIPDQQGQNPQMLVDVGLADFVAGAEFMQVGSKSPSGTNSPGALIGWRKPGATDFGYFPDRQTWHPAVRHGDLAAGRYWVGIWNHSRPTPDDLRRPYAHRGQSLEMGDGNTWIIPEPEKLPRDMILADDGSWKFELQRQFHDYGLEVDGWKRHMEAGNDKFVYIDAAETITKALRLNYRIIPEIQNELRLLNTNNAETALLAVMGVLGLIGGAQP